MLESKKEDRYVLKPAKTFKFAQNTCVGQVLPMQFLLYFRRRVEIIYWVFSHIPPFCLFLGSELFRFSGSSLSTDIALKRRMNDFIRSLSPEIMRKSSYSDLLLTMFWQLSSIPRQFSKNVATSDWIWTNGSWELTKKYHDTFQFFLSQISRLHGRQTCTSMLLGITCVSDLTTVLFTGAQQRGRLERCSTTCARLSTHPCLFARVCLCAVRWRVCSRLPAPLASRSRSRVTRRKTAFMMINNNDGREGFPWGHRQVARHVQQRLHPQDLLPQPRPRG